MQSVQLVIWMDARANNFRWNSRGFMALNFRQILFWSPIMVQNVLFCDCSSLIGRKFQCRLSVFVWREYSSRDLMGFFLLCGQTPLDLIWNHFRFMNLKLASIWKKRSSVSHELLLSSCLQADGVITLTRAFCLVPQLRLKLCWIQILQCTTAMYQW